jgi:hypothetical protein
VRGAVSFMERSAKIMESICVDLRSPMTGSLH